MFVLGLIGVPMPVGAALGLVFRAKTIVLGLIGGVVYASMISSRDLDRVAVNSEADASGSGLR